MRHKQPYLRCKQHKRSQRVTGKYPRQEGKERKGKFDTWVLCEQRTSRREFQETKPKEENFTGFGVRNLQFLLVDNECRSLVIWQKIKWRLENQSIYVCILRNLRNYIYAYRHTYIVDKQAYKCIRVEFKTRRPWCFVEPVLLSFYYIIHDTVHVSAEV